MDPVSAIGLASSLVQLVTFTGDLLSKTRAIYHSADGSLQEHGELEAITRALESQNRRIAVQSSSLRLGSLETTKDLLTLCDGVRDLTRELTKKIDALKAHDSGSKWDSLRLALKSVWEEKDITDLVRRLERYRQQIDSILLASLQERLNIFTATSKDRNAKIEQNFSRIIESLRPGSEWHRQLIDTARQGLKEQKLLSTTQLKDFSASLSAGAEHDREKFLKLRMLESLKFSDMKDRYERISEAHKSTFDWIFHEADDAEDGGGHWDNFSNWLMSNKPLYWITGKPGSGKSTLMKYLSDDRRLRSQLRVWKGDNPLSMGKFFFWNSGTALQMSGVGLLQSLLYQAVSDWPDEVPNLFPDRWQYQHYFGYDSRPWSWSEVSSGFKNLVADQRKYFFFLIDGLDEFDGDCAELADLLLRTTSSTPNVKLCLASRPWLVFEDAFRQRPSLRVEDLTLKDIRIFASDKLSENRMFEELRAHDPDNAQKLIEEVTARSSGVFLWVRLVVKSLLEGLRDGDTMDDLSARLYLIPKDLEDLFQKILGDLDATYFEQASQIFQTVGASLVSWQEINSRSKGEETLELNKDGSSPLTLLTLSFIGEDVDRALSAKYGSPMDWDQQCYQAERMRRRLSSRCKGLVEAPTYADSGPNTTVQYLHRTVKDFFQEDRMKRFLLAGTKDTFNPHVALCSALVRHTKAINPKEDDERSMKMFSRLIGQFMVHCHWLEARRNPSYVSFLEEMDKTTEAIFDDEDAHLYTDLPHWTQRVDPSVSTSSRVHSVLDYAVARSLTHYVRAQQAAGGVPASNVNRQYLDDYATENRDQEMTDLLGSQPSRQGKVNESNKNVMQSGQKVTGFRQSQPSQVGIVNESNRNVVQLGQKRTGLRHKIKSLCSQYFHKSKG
ncbi:hypothetical protein B0T10DRAFT_497781 [Thelonectria olida]|uniref:NACHT domain-containing protein n=1 Tax=Thelonectria olida TaxID=1576542 RepID=A0A9P8VWI0_9HYPO|nr:hypothetical protein B0T10DRAFT_497781 [Thelonectria olida]